MKVYSSILLAALAFTFSSTPALAEHLVHRIDHPNGPATYVTKPDESRRSVFQGSRGATIGVYAGERSFGRQDRETRWEPMTDNEGRMLVPIHNGRGQTQWVPVQR